MSFRSETNYGSGIALLAALWMFAHGAATATPSGEPITFSNQVARIFQRSCQRCHRPGQMAPMSLTTFGEARPWAKSIKNRVVRREMPPWDASPKQHGHFINERTLTDDQIATIKAWVSQGVARGNPSDAPEPVADAGIRVIVTITEGIPTKDMMIAKEYLNGKDTVLVGPNCPGVITPGEAKVGIMPGFIHQKGGVGIVSRSGTLTYEAVDQVTKTGLGQSTCIGIGGDPIIGTSTRDAVQLLMEDPETEGIIMIGEIGGSMEADAANWIKENGTKPVVGFIAGQTAPKGRRMGHAGAIIGGADDTAAAKMKIMQECGIHVVDSPADLGETMAKVLNENR